jgi:hypothetical protein
MNKKKLIELRCKAWGITEDEYYCNQCSDFSLEDMARAYRRGKNKGRADLEKENAELKKNYEDSLIACGVLKAKVDTLAQSSPLESMQDALITTQKVVNEKQKEQLTKATKVIKDIVEVMVIAPIQYSERQKIDVLEKAEQFLKEE